jgi:CRISPR type III-A-associated RAMP protein Csm4
VARLAPAALIESILLGQKILADQWVADSESACLLRRDRPSTTPFRTVLRIAAAVDRASGRSTLAHPIACVEFEPGAGLWFVLRFRDQNSSAAWGERLRAMLRLLGDTGFGGRRSAGWGQTQAPEIQDGQWPHVLFPKLARLPRTDTASSLHWLLSLFSPSPDDAIDWTNGEYTLLERGAELGKRARFVAEGSVLAAATSPVGMAVDVGNGVGNGRAHPVYRSGMALSLPLPVITPEETLPEETPEAELEPEITLPDAVEQPADSEEPPAEPCAVIEEEPEPEPAPIREPEPEPEPITDPEPEPGPITEPEPRQSEADPRTEEKDAL